ncbi:endonuclease/exonuclease/phosphatase family protein [Pleurocapsa sp. FMAR1]|uniref:endonuclease/exonuclease/phosphatase family protein n=1 Tax=Pleurocapsa sp. FMAR1 TaxID=3040204 RepID=UPI0029C6CBC5|nr:endonuclease/exonuclease/phosphatase family protein [Pleurocapsa sp. FMAR1]
MFNKKCINVNYYLFACLSISAIALSLAGYLGRFNLYFEFASGYKLQFLLMALCSLVYFLLTHEKLWIAASLFCVLLNLAEILPWYFNQPKITNPEQYQALKVFSYNVLWSNKNYDKAIALVNQEQPDIAVFLEAIPHWHPHLAALSSSYPYHVRSEKMEMEVYSKLPLANPQLKLYGTYRGLIIADIKVGDRLVRFVATHAYPQLYYGRPGWEIRNQHLEIGIGEYVKTLTQPVIVIGDLNVSMWSPFYYSMIKLSGLHNARQGFGILPTHSIVAPQVAALSAPIDHCLVSADIQVKNFKLGRAIGSDHLPIIAELLIPQLPDSP